MIVPSLMAACCLLFYWLIDPATERKAYSYNHIVITEILPDPSPSVGLPLYEFIELTNTGSDPVNLQGFAISDGSSTAVISRSYILPPDSLLILCSTTAYSQYEKWGRSMALSGLPSLNNDADTLLLFGPDRQLVQSIAYTSGWHENELKSGGGWSLELIDPLQPCLQQSNWSSSKNPLGGTPGQINSVKSLVRDSVAPTLKKVYCIDSTHIVAQFDESVDSNQARQLSHYSLEAINILQAKALPPLYLELSISLATSLQPGKQYHLQITGIKDCSGNVSITPLQLPVGIPESPIQGDLLISEILFDPPAGGKDFIELYNHSNRIIDLKEIWLANRDATGMLKNLTPASAFPQLFFPGEWIALTEDTFFARNYFHPAPSAKFLKSILPSLPADMGRLAVLDRQGLAIDEAAYDEHWHFPMIAEKKGVSLERISYDESGLSKENWMSASYPVRFGTPGYQNSQYHQRGIINGKIEVSPVVFSPNLDGLDDYCFIDYHFDQAGYMATIEVYDYGGNRVRVLLNNQLSGQKGRIRWDGITDGGKLASPGNYIILVRAWHLSGKTNKWKKVVVVGG